MSFINRVLSISAAQTDATLNPTSSIVKFNYPTLVHGIECACRMYDATGGVIPLVGSFSWYLDQNHSASLFENSGTWIVDHLAMLHANGYNPNTSKFIQFIRPLQFEERESLTLWGYRNTPFGAASSGAYAEFNIHITEIRQPDTLFTFRDMFKQYP